MYGVQLALRQRNWYSPDYSTWKPAEAPTTRSKSPCTDTKKLFQYRLQYLDDRLRYPSPEASHLALIQKLVLSRLEHLDNS